MQVKTLLTQESGCVLNIKKNEKWLNFLIPARPVVTNVFVHLSQFCNSNYSCNAEQNTAHRGAKQR